MIKSSPDGRFSVLTLDPKYREALEGLEEFSRIILIYFKDENLDVHVAELIKMAGDDLYLRHSEKLESATVLDIKPFFDALDA